MLSRAVVLWRARSLRWAFAVLILSAIPRLAEAQILLEDGDDIEWVDERWAAARGDRPGNDLTRVSEASRVEKVIGADDREGVGDTTSYPWRTIGLIVSSYKSSTETAWYGGTGVLIGRKTVLTCAHILVHDQQWGENVTFTPGKDGDDEPYGSFKAVKKRVRREYFYDEDMEYDIGLMVLDKPIGNTTDYMRIEVKPESFFDAAALNVAGYPGDLSDNDKLYHAFGRSDGVIGNLIRHKVDTAIGQSGAPVWIYSRSAQKRRLVAVHMRGGEDYNVAVYIDDFFWEWIKAYLKENDTVYYWTSSSAADHGDSTGEGQPCTPECGCAATGAVAATGLTLLAFAAIRPARRRRGAKTASRGGSGRSEA